MKKFMIRALTGILFAAILVGSMLYEWQSFKILFLLITALSVNEFSTLLKQHKNITFKKALAILCSIFLFLAFAAMTHNWEVPTLLLFTPYIITVAYIFISRLFSKEGNALENHAYFALTQLYVALPFSLLNILAMAGAPAGETYHWLFPLSIFIFIWCNDTGAYCVGCTIGRHKMFERISPKKTWEGFFGGVAVAVGASVAMSHYFTVMNVLEWIGMAVVVVIAGTLGDLIESSMKREMQIKDSGNILPGHGGLLDRFDSTIFAVPCVIAYLVFIGML